MKTKRILFMSGMSLLMFVFLAFSISAQAEKPDKKSPTTTQVDKSVPVDLSEIPNVESAKPLSDDELVSRDFIYKPEGRRDPFVNLLKGNKNTPAGIRKGEGLAALLIDELELEGIILRKNGTFVALFKAPDGKPYDVKVGDSVYDGEVIKIDINTVYFKHSTTMALGGTKEKIITKSLIPEEEAEKK